MIYGWLFFFFFKQKTAYEMRISDWSSDVCSSDLVNRISVCRKCPHYTRGWRRGECAFLRPCPSVEDGTPAWENEAAVKSFGRRGSRKIGRASCRERVCQYV